MKSIKIISAKYIEGKKLKGSGVIFSPKVSAELVETHHRRNRPGAGGALWVHG
jgi:hypothetical protein